MDKIAGNIIFIDYKLPIKSFVINYAPVSLNVMKSSDISSSIKLKQKEIECVKSFKTQKRRLEYILSRKLAKYFISESFGVDIVDIEIKGGIKFPPFATFKGITLPISISHRFPIFAVSFSFNNDVVSGVDIEKFDDVDETFLSDFLHPFEMLDNKIAILSWSIKESLLKTCWCGMSLPAKDILVTQNEVMVDGMVLKVMKKLNINSFKVIIHKYSDYVVCLTVGFKNFLN